MLYLLILPAPTPENPGQRKFKCRIEELPVLAKFLINALERDLSDFTAEFSEMNLEYLNAFIAKRTRVVNFLEPKKFTKELRKVTERMAKNMRRMRPLLNRLQVSVKRAHAAGELSILPKDFGMAQVRAAISNGDAEQFNGAMHFLKQNITEQYTALTNHSYTNAKRDALYFLADSIDADNERQNILLSDRDELVEANIALFNELWAIMTEVCEAGKSIYAQDRPAKADKYTMDKLLNRIRQEDPAVRQRVILFEEDETKVLHNIVAGSQITNTGATTFAYWAGPGPIPPGALEIAPGATQTLPAEWGSTLSARNLSSSTFGKLRVLAIGSTE